MSFLIAYEFQCHGVLGSDNLEKKGESREYLKFKNSEVKRKEGMTSEVLLSKDLMHIKVRNNRCISVLKPYLYMFVLVFM